MAMVILAKNQWIKKIKNETSDEPSKPLNVEYWKMQEQSYSQ